MALTQMREIAEVKEAGLVKELAALKDAARKDADPAGESGGGRGDVATGENAGGRVLGFVVSPPEEGLITVDLDIVQHGFIDYSGQFYLISPRSLASPDARRMSLFLTLLQEHGFGRQVLWPNSRVIKKRLQQQKSCFASFDRFTVLKLRNGAWSQIFRGLRDGDADFASLHYQARGRFSRALQRVLS